jgi:hypothetical protein
MSGWLQTPDSVDISVVATAPGSATLMGQNFPKARVWILEDRSAIVCSVGPGGIERRKVFVRHGSFNRQTNRLVAEVSQLPIVEESVTADIASADAEPSPPSTEQPLMLIVDASGCNCGMGAVANAGPFDSPYNIIRVRDPEWFENVG